jgi:hypothetical protein
MRLLRAFAERGRRSACACACRGTPLIWRWCSGVGTHSPRRAAIHCRREFGSSGDGSLTQQTGWHAATTLGTDISADTARSLASPGTGASVWSPGEQRRVADCARPGERGILRDLHQRAPSLIQTNKKPHRYAVTCVGTRRHDDPWCHPGYRLLSQRGLFIRVHCGIVDAIRRTCRAQWSNRLSSVSRLEARSRGGSLPGLHSIPGR